MRPMFRWLAALALACVIPAAHAQQYPAHPVRMIVPFPAGGPADLVARLLSANLAKVWGQPLVIENRGGAGGNIGTAAVAQADPDGYTLVLGYDGTLVINPHVYTKIPFDTLRDFAPVTKLGDATLILVANPNAGVRSLKDLIQAAKTRPFPYGTSGTGNTTHLVAELLKQKTGTKLEHVPYKGGGPALIDVVGGQIPLVFTAIASAQQYVHQGRLIALGVPSAKRSSALPDVPTFEESGVAPFDVSSWVGILAPAKTPRPVIDRLNKELAAVLQSPFVKERYAVLGIEPVGNSPTQFGEEIKADLARWADVVKAANVKVE